MSIKTGTANYGGEFTKRKYWKLKDGESTFRILPPLGFNGKDPTGRWSQFYNVHYGYKNSKGQMRAFQSPLVKNRKTRMVEAPDAALERIETLRAKQTEAKAKGDEASFKKLGDLLQKYNLDNNHYVNAIDEQGNIGILKLRHRAKLALEATIKSLRDQGIDPLGVETGRFFTFRRSGMGLDTTFQVTIKKRKLKVDGIGEVEQDIVHALAPDILTRLEKEAVELDSIFKRPTSEEVARIVKDSDLMSGMSKSVDEILDKKAEGNDNYNDEENYVEETQPANQTTVKANVSAPETITTAANTTVLTTAPAQSTSLSTSGAPKTTAQAVTEMTDEDFLKSLGL